MTALKPHVAINVRDFGRSLTFYRTFFGLEPVRVRPGYAKFDVEQRKRQTPHTLRFSRLRARVMHSNNQPRQGTQRGDFSCYAFFPRLRIRSGRRSDHGSNSSIAARSSVRMLGNRSNRYSRYRYGSSPFSLAVSTRL